MGADGGELTGKVSVNGSSTVAPISMAAAEMFQSKQPKVQITVGISGTGGGFKKFLDDRADLRIDICDASRAIEASEIERAKKLGIEFVELPIALDGMAVVVHPGNSFCNDLTVAELKRIWEPGSTINNWKDIRPGFPDLPLKLYGPGTDSGTFDYFTAAVVGKEKACRSDYTGSENDNVLVQGVSGDKGSLGYFGFAYYDANKAKLKLLAVAHGAEKPVLPSLETIRTGVYTPLSRPLFIYINKASLSRPEVKAFAEFYLENAPAIVQLPGVHYVPLSDELYNLAKQRVAKGTSGSAFEGVSSSGPRNLLELYRGK